jgi:hypothetical protein
MWLFAPGNESPAGAGNNETPECTEEREVPQYAKWVRERETTESEWGEWYLWDNGSVTSWSPGSGYLSPLMQYEYRPNGVTKTVEVEVECPPETTAEETTTTVTDSTTSTSTTAPETTSTSTTSTLPPTTSSSSPTTSTTTVPPGTAPSTTTDPCANGCVSSDPPAVILVCRGGAVVEIHPRDRLGADSDDLDHCGWALPATR